MPNWAGSCWYELRYCDPDNADAFVDPGNERYWMGPQHEGDCGGTDLYIGGIEHAVLHLLYARFFTKVLRDLGFVDLDEPFRRLLTQGMVIKDGAKMSKSKGNVVDPDSLIERYGADTARLFCLFASPPERDLDWSDQGVEGMSRFLGRVWRLVQGALPRLAAPGTLPSSEAAVDRELHRATHQTIRRVTADVVDRLHFNTAIAAVMELVTATLAVVDSAHPAALREAVDTTLLLLSPFVPHVASELWETVGHADGLADAPWPAPEETVLAVALGDERVQAQVAGRPLRKRVVVPGRMVSLVV
jgi:leucyl-tRNA synthetase